MLKRGDEAILESWRANASAWIDIVERGGIPSRVAVTDAAIVDAVLAYAPRRVLDIGCGEGWLVRALEGRGIRATGVDAVPALVERASASARGAFTVLSYEELACGQHDLAASFDAAVCNFSLFGETIVPRTMAALNDLLVPRGLLFVQTLHPGVACGDRPCADGWRAGSRAGLGPAFESPPPWYFRTTESWLSLVDASGFDILEVREPTAPGGAVPSSILFVGRAR